VSDTSPSGARRFFGGLFTTLAFVAVVAVVLAITWVIASGLATPAGQW
jgi:hypothetical protein